MNLKVGIVGLPNAGKSTLFNALLKRQVAEAANYPFTTIEPNIGVVPVPDDRLEKLAEIVESEEGIRPPRVPAIVEFVDIAGLVKGASEGQGLGNKFLSHIREVDIICQVVRYFLDPTVMHVDGDVNPSRDRETIQTELILADLQTLLKQIEPKSNAKKEEFAKWQVVQLLRQGLNQGKLARDVTTESEDRKMIADLHLLTMKPILYVANVSEAELRKYSSSEESSTGREVYKDSSRLRDVPSGTSLRSNNNNFIAISAQIESELSSLSEDDQRQYLRELGVEKSGLDRLIQKAYEMLGLISFLTCGVKEVRAWTIVRSTKAPEAAGVIHTDFEKKFIKADVISYGEFVSVGGWKKAREVGKVRSEGKEYETKDGDVVEFKIGT